MKERIAIVVQRYGLEVNGGSEYSCRLVAERLSKYYEVDVLTTKALDYMTWENHYDNNLEQINNVNVRRFSTDAPRDVNEFNKYSEYIYHNLNRTVYEELDWMKKQGPVSFGLLEYIKLHSNEYKAFIFFTYTYFTTYFGVQLVPEKSIIVPTAHDEPPIYLSIYRPFFNLPRQIIFLTPEEKQFVHELFGNSHIPSDVAGIGVDIPESYLTETEFRKKFNISDPYVIYVGRIDESKGCAQLFEYYLRYKKENSNYPKLLLMGKSVMNVPKDKDIISLGFVSEEEKFGGLSGAEFLLMPSKYESLSMVVLESLSLEIPILVNSECEVLKGHCERGNAGLYYNCYEEFQLCMNFLLNNKELSVKLGKHGANYVNSNYKWDIIEGKFLTAIENINRHFRLTK